MVIEAVVKSTLYNLGQDVCKGFRHVDILLRKLLKREEHLIKCGSKGSVLQLLAFIPLTNVRQSTLGLSQNKEGAVPRGTELTLVSLR